jgi:hypothetical protein
MALLFLVEWITGWMLILRQRTSWLAFAIIRFLGGGLLIAFAFRLWGPKFALMHPVPLSAFISGLVQIWRGMASLIRRKSTPDGGNH